MYASVNQWSFGGDLSPLSCLRAAKEIGFRGFEPAFDEEGSLSFAGFEQGAKALREEAEALDIKLPSLASGLYWKYSFTSEDKAIREKALDIARRQLDCAAALGAPAILVVPGTVGRGFFGQGVGSVDAYARAQEALSQLAPYAQQCGVVIGAENVWNNFLLSPLEWKRFLDEIGSPYVKMYLDVGNLVPYGEGADWIATLGERIACIHVKDFRRSVGTLSGFVPLLEGDVDWPNVIAALRAIGFDGALTAEMNVVEGRPLFAAKQAALALNDIIGA